MAASSLARARNEVAVARAKASAAAVAKRARAEVEKRRHTVAMGVAMAGIGFYEARGNKLPSLIDGIPPKIQLAVVAALVADNTSGEFSQYASALCDGAVAVAAYNFGRGQDIGAADDEVEI